MTKLMFIVLYMNKSRRNHTQTSSTELDIGGFKRRFTPFFVQYVFLLFFAYELDYKCAAWVENV